MAPMAAYGRHHFIKKPRIACGNSGFERAVEVQQAPQSEQQKNYAGNNA
jgi:hypothetical protein